MGTDEIPNTPKLTAWQRFMRFLGFKVKEAPVEEQPVEEQPVQEEPLPEAEAETGEEPVQPAEEETYEAEEPAEEPVEEAVELTEEPAEESALAEEIAETAEDPVDESVEEPYEEAVSAFVPDMLEEVSEEFEEITANYVDEDRTEWSSSVYMNRELSWLEFNERVLEEAESPAVPLGERLTFASIYQTNLDEFFMVRVGKLIDKNKKDPLSTDQHTQMTSKQQIDQILDEVNRMIPRRDRIYETLMSELENQGIRLVNFHKIGDEESKKLEKYFDKEIRPLMEPNIVGANQPFPFLQNEAIYAGAILITKSGNTRLGIIPCSSGTVQRLIPVGNKPGTYMLVEELILHFLPKIFKEYTVKAKSLIRITRSGNIDADKLYNHDLDYREFMAEMIRKRKKLPAVRLELSRELEKKVVDILCTYLKIDHTQVFFYKEPLDLSFVFQLQDLLRNNHPELFYQRRVPKRAVSVDPYRPILDQIKDEDKLLSYPYNSMGPFLAMLRQAAYDENVVSIKMTLYRVAKESKVIEYLCDAAEHGKEVLVMVELKARFDEENNVSWSRVLEAAGCHVIYGIPGYKVHSKLLLITRRVNGETEYFTQIGTGNYNEKTARLYTDMSLLTANETIGKDAASVFQHLVKGELIDESEALLVAPNCLTDQVLKMMDEQIRRQKAGGTGYIGFKINSLGDKRIIEKIVEASCAGVKVDLIVRGICCLIPGVPGKTDNVRVISIVGRYLEHTRIYMFGKPEKIRQGMDKIYISSADFLDRNTMHRVEVAAPILDENLKKEIHHYFDLQLRDNVQAREMLNDGTYLRVKSQGAPVSAQEQLFAEAYRAIGEKLPEEIAVLGDVE